MRRRRTAAVVAATGLLAGCGSTALRTGEPAYDEARPTWALGSAVHYGDDTFEVPGHVVLELVPTDYGWMVLLAGLRGADDERPRWHFFDGEGLQPLGAEVESVVASPDGRHVGWVDRHGPLRPAGRVAEVVVLDLASGETVLESHDGMGGGLGDDLEDLYGEVPPTFQGFDEQHAYWTNAEGHGVRMRGDLGSGEVESAEATSGEPGDGLPAGAYIGSEVGVVDGRPDTTGAGGALGALSPDGRFVAETGAAGRVRVYAVEQGRRVDLDLGRSRVSFGGWLDDGSFFVVTRDRRSPGRDPAGAAGDRGSVTECSTLSGRCERVARIDEAGSVVTPYAGAGDS